MLKLDEEQKKDFCAFCVMFVKAEFFALSCSLVILLFVMLLLYCTAEKKCFEGPNLNFITADIRYLYLFSPLVHSVGVGEPAGG